MLFVYAIEWHISFLFEDNSIHYDASISILNKLL